MEILDDLTAAGLQHETVVTIGTYDGVHVGHQAIIGGMVERARATGRLAAVVTFHPHPAAVLAPDRAPLLLTMPGDKAALLEAVGVDLVVLLPFTRELANTPARRFVGDLCRHLRMRELWVGADFALGRNREGDVDRLKELGGEFGYHLHVVTPVLDRQSGSDLISSSRIRALLGEGRVEEAAGMLGRYPTLSGEVVMGAQRGRTLGFPTANLDVRPGRAVPANGVYAVYALLEGRRYPAVANVGIRPSFDNGQRTVETHLFDFDRDIYGCNLVVEFVARLRAERRFEDIDDLVAQIEADSQEARRQLAAAGPAWRPDGVEPGFPLETAGALGLGGEQALDDCRYRVVEVEHTADRAIRVWGRSLADLFAGAARGMAGLMTDLEGQVATIWREVDLQAPDHEILLVEWLNEILFIMEMEGWVLVQARVESLDERILVARAGFVRGEVTGAHIKAATFHDLAIVRSDGGWETVITLDV